MASALAKERSNLWSLQSISSLLYPRFTVLELLDESDDSAIFLAQNQRARSEGLDPFVRLKVSEKELVIHDATLQPHGINSLFPADGVLGMRQFDNRIVHFNMRRGFFIVTD